MGSYDHDGGYVWSKKWSNLNLVQVKAMCGEFGEVTVIIGLVINFLAFVPPFVSFRDTLSYVDNSTMLITKKTLHLVAILLL